MLSVNAYGNSFIINENDKFECSWSEGNYLIKILKKYDDKYIVIQKKLNDKYYVHFGSLNGKYLEFLWSIKKDFLTSEMIIKKNDKYLNLVFVVKPTIEQARNFESKKSKFDNKKFDKIQILDLSEDELKNEIDVHNSKLSIFNEIFSSKENIKQFVNTSEINCRKDRSSKEEEGVPPDVQQYLQYKACLRKIKKDQVPIELRAEEEKKCLNLHYPK